jgi:hypothetical protein
VDRLEPERKSENQKRLGGNRREQMGIRKSVVETRRD